MHSNEFKRAIEIYSENELIEIYHNMDRDKYPENFNILISEMLIRKISISTSEVQDVTLEKRKAGTLQLCK